MRRESYHQGLGEELKKEYIIMSEEKKNMNLDELENVVGGTIGQQPGGGWKVIDNDGNVIESYNTLEEAEFAASGICPRCKKIFSGKEAINAHIKEWALGRK